MPGSQIYGLKANRHLSVGFCGLGLAVAFSVAATVFVSEIPFLTGSAETGSVETASVVVLGSSAFPIDLFSEAAGRVSVSAVVVVCAAAVIPQIDIIRGTKQQMARLQ